MTVAVAEDTDQRADVSAADPSSSPSSKKVARTQGRAIDYKGAGKRLADRCITDARNNQARLDRDRQDWQNLLMYRGGESQWMVYDKGQNTYVPRGNDPDQGGLPDWVPRPATNIFANKIDGIVSLLTQSEPAKLFSPSTDDDADRATAEVAEDADPVLLKEIDYDSLRPQLNKLVALTDSAALVVWYDNDEKYGTEQIDMLRCPQCGLETTPMVLEDEGNVCPDCGTPGDAFEPVIDETGTPVGVPYAKGKICASVIPSFEFSRPSTARSTDAKKLPWVLTHSTMTKADCIARWGDAAKNAVDKHGGKKVGGIQRAYARAMQQLSSPARANAPAAAMGGSAANADDPVVYILHHDPINDGEYYFPDGLLIILIEDEVMEAGPLPITDDEDRAVKGVLIRTYMQGPGTAFGKPPADDLVPLQRSRNLVDSLIQLILMHDAAPRNWIPLSVTLENLPTGRPGENIYYRSTVPGERPQSDRGINPPDGLYKYLEIIDQKMEEVSKLNAVLAGERPEGDPTLGEVQILQERGMSAFKEPFDQQIRFEEDLSRLLMWIAKRSAWSTRFRQIRGENGQWEVRQFTAADLNGRIDIQIDKQSAWPKSPLMRMIRAEKALQLGVLQPPAQDPELQQQFLSLLDLLEMKPSIGADWKQIARELEKWKAAHTPDQIKPPDPATQELPTHLHFKRKFLKTEEFEALRDANPPLAQAMVDHVTKLQEMVAEAQKRTAEPPKTSFSVKADLTDPDTRKLFEQANDLPATPPPAPPAAPTGPDGTALNHAVSSGALMPAGAQPPPDHLGHAVSSGALVPAAAAPQPAPGPSIDDLVGMGAMAPAPPPPTETR